MFWLLFFMPLAGSPVTDHRMTPTIPLVALPYDATRLAPWAADYTTRAHFPLDTERLPAPEVGDYRPDLTPGAPGSDSKLTDLERENQLLRERIELLERMMKQSLSQPPVPAPQPGETVTDGQKTVPGWRAELYGWNKDGVYAADPYRTILTQSCPFNGTFGHQADNEMSLYRFLGIFRAKAQGRYVFALDTTCGFGHLCRASMAVDGAEIINFTGKTDYQRLQNGVALTPGDHRIEFRISLNSNSFVKYEPDERFRWQPMVKTPDDLEAREYAVDELFTVVPAATTVSSKGCTR